MHFSRKTDYGIILVAGLRKTYNSHAFESVREIAERERLPFAFLEKLAESLRKAGYLEAKRGKTGGYRLMRDPETITFRALIDLFEEPPMMKCMKSPHPEKYCPLVRTCPSRKTWLGVEERVNKIFENVTVAEI